MDRAHRRIRRADVHQLHLVEARRAARNMNETGEDGVSGEWDAAEQRARLWRRTRLGEAGNLIAGGRRARGGGYGRGRRRYRGGRIARLRAVGVGGTGAARNGRDH